MKRQLTKQERWAKTHPWAKHVRYARRRCSDAKHEMYSRYGGRGIVCPLTAADAKVLWGRDRADRMRRPSLDRIDPDGNYTLENCRFIELVQNIARSARPDTSEEPW